MKRYIAHMHTKSPHERRQHAVQVAGAATVVVAVFWLATLAYSAPFAAPETGSVSSEERSQLANTISALPGAISAFQVSPVSVFDTEQQ